MRRQTACRVFTRRVRQSVSKDNADRMSVFVQGEGRETVYKEGAGIAYTRR